MLIDLLCRNIEVSALCTQESRIRDRKNPLSPIRKSAAEHPRWLQCSHAVLRQHTHAIDLLLYRAIPVQKILSLTLRGHASFCAISCTKTQKNKALPPALI